MASVACIEAVAQQGGEHDREEDEGQRQQGVDRPQRQPLAARGTNTLSAPGTAPRTSPISAADTALSRDAGAPANSLESTSLPR